MQIHEVTPGIRAVLRELAKHPGGVHSSNPQLAQWTPMQICVQGRRLVAMGQLFSAKVSHRHVRYFSSAEARDQFIRTMAAKHPAAGRNRRHDVLAIAGNAPWPADAPAIETERTVYTQCPSHAPRYQEHVFGHLHGRGAGPRHA